MINESDKCCYREDEGGRRMVVEKDCVFLNRRPNPQIHAWS